VRVINIEAISKSGPAYKSGTENCRRASRRKFVERSPVEEAA